MSAQRREETGGGRRGRADLHPGKIGCSLHALVAQVQLRRIVACCRQQAHTVQLLQESTAEIQASPAVSALRVVLFAALGFAIALSVIAVLFYLWFRFERELAIGAIIGTLHDIVLTVGFFVITQHEFNMTSIAAILTIVGYSLNETVVVFDRTRELMRRYKTMPVKELLNLSINTTMSRTVMTATTTALSLLALVIFGVVFAAAQS